LIVDEKIPDKIRALTFLSIKFIYKLLVVHNKMFHVIELSHQNNLFHLLMFVKVNSK
jgi:hypothetical protein